MGILLNMQAINSSILWRNTHISNGYSAYIFNVCSDPKNESTPNMAWWDAENDCMMKGGHLASIRNMEENNFMAGQIRSINSYHVWIGLNEIDGLTE